MQNLENNRIMKKNLFNAFRQFWIESKQYNSKMIVAIQLNEFEAMTIYEDGSRLELVCNY